MTELRVADLRFTHAEAAGFLNQVMGLDLVESDIAALETRTEGWIAGLQLAALALQGSSADKRQETGAFITSFTGSHRFVLDYLVEEVLQQQSPEVQDFLLHTAVLDRLCGPLCDQVLLAPAGTSQEKLIALEHSNLFIVPLDNERRWYRYHHLFADLLRQRQQQHELTADRSDKNRFSANELHHRASIWYEEQGLDVEAFQHAAAANNVQRAERLIESKGRLPLHFRGAVTPILNWLSSLSDATLNDTPSLWTTYASVLLVTGQTSHVERKLQAAEAVLNTLDQDETTRDLLGRVAAIRSTLAATHNQVDQLIAQSNLALELLHPANIAFRMSTMWKLGYAYHLLGDRPAAQEAFEEVVAISATAGDNVFTIRRWLA